ncbi:MAG: CU044_5270 family protein, partial [Nonomuraea sp.]|nr:CU044_5270 family protein [Nonomuraea sp.]
RERLLAEARGGRRFRLPRLGWQAAAAFGVTVVLVGGVAAALSGQETPGTRPATSATLTSGELDPRPGQFILVESETMYGAHRVDASGGETRYLYRQHRKIWKSVDGSANGLLLIEGKEPKPWPGEPLPEEADDWRHTEWNALAACPDLRGAFRDDYAYLSTLPADASAMRDRLYQELDPAVAKEKGVDPDVAAFREAGDLVRENYLPRPQRDALFAAITSIPGVEQTEGVADSAGREGVALGRVMESGVREELIFDPADHTFMGERQTATGTKAGAPEDSVLALTAQLKVSVVDDLPSAPAAAPDGSCAQPTLAPTDESTAVFTPEPSETTLSATRKPQDDPQPTVTITVTPARSAPPADPEPTRTVTATPAGSTQPADR